MTSKTQNGNGSSACPTTPGGTTLATYSYHSSGMGRGQVATVGGTNNNVTFTDSFTYDYRGRVTTTNRTIAGTGYSLSTGYDLLDRPTALTYPGGEVVATGYDKQVANTLTITNTNTTLVSNVTYNHRLEMNSIVLGNTLTQDYNYYPASGNYRLQSALTKYTATGVGVFNRVYTYDPVGNISQITTGLIGQAQELQYFTYDSLGRLKTAYANDGPAPYSHTGNNDYDYDAIGNLTNMAGTPMSYQDGTHKHAVTHRNGNLAFTYDANGNMVTRIEGSTTYTQAFDVENRLKTVSLTGNNNVTNFAYDASGQRLRTTVAPTIPATDDIRTTTTYPFPGYEVETQEKWQCIGPKGGSCTWQWTTQATITRKTYFLGGQAIATHISGDPSSGNNGFFYLHSDHLGSTSLLTNSSGVKVSGSETRYYPYGSQRGTAPTQSITDKNFTGQKENLEINAIYYNARFYLPQTGRFMTADTVIPDPANPQAFNRYTYTLNNALRFVDPTGHWSCSGREDCETTVETWLTLLDEAGELGQSLAGYFRDSDIEVNFLDDENIAMAADFLKNQIRVGIQQMEQKFANEGSDGWLLLFTQFGHEVEHVRQGFVQANSIQGEYQAYRTQIELANNWDSKHGTTIVTDMLIGNGSPNTRIRYLDFLSDWNTVGANLDPSSHADMEKFYSNNLALVSSWQYDHSPVFPGPQEASWRIQQMTNMTQKAFNQQFGWLYSLAYWSP